MRSAADGVSELERDRVEAIEHLAGGADAVLDVAPHVLRGVELGLLREESDRRPVGEPGVAAEAGIEARHDPQQRRLARAVGPEHADLRPVVEGEGDVLEDDAIGRVLLDQPVHRVDEGGVAHGPQGTSGEAGTTLTAGAGAWIHP